MSVKSSVVCRWWRRESSAPPHFFLLLLHSYSFDEEVASLFIPNRWLVQSTAAGFQARRYLPLKLAGRVGERPKQLPAAWSDGRTDERTNERTNDWLAGWLAGWLGCPPYDAVIVAPIVSAGCFLRMHLCIFLTVLRVLLHYSNVVAC